MALHDYELLEPILFRALAPRDIKPLARDLLDQFGDLSVMLSAAYARLLEVTGIGQAVIAEFRLIEAVALNSGQRPARLRQTTAEFHPPRRWIPDAKK